MSSSRLSDIALPDIILPDVPHYDMDCQITASTSCTSMPSLPEFTLPDPELVPTILSNPGTSDSRNVVQVEHERPIKLQGPEANAKTLGEFKMCTLCNIHLNSKTQADLHYAGKVHQKKLRQKALAESAEFNWIVSASANSKGSSTVNLASESKGGMCIRHCDVCGLTFTGLSQVQAHLMGARHAKKLKQLAQTKTEEETGEEGGEPVEAETRPGPDDAFYCKHCNKVCTSQSQLDQHFQGSKHKNVVAAATKLTDECFMPPPITTKEPTANTAMYVCPACNVTTNSEQQYLQHCGGSSHKERLKNHSNRSNVRHEPYPIYRGGPPVKGNYTSKSYKTPNQRNRFNKGDLGNNYRPTREQDMRDPTSQDCQDMTNASDFTPYNNTSFRDEERINYSSETGDFDGRFEDGWRNINWDESSEHLSQISDRRRGWNDQYPNY